MAYGNPADNTVSQCRVATAWVILGVLGFAMKNNVKTWVILGFDVFVSWDQPKMFWVILGWDPSVAVATLKYFVFNCMMRLTRCFSCVL